VARGWLRGLTPLRLPRTQALSRRAPEHLEVANGGRRDLRPKKVLIFVPDSLTWFGSIVIIRHQIALTFGRPKLDAIIDRKDVIFTDRV